MGLAYTGRPEEYHVFPVLQETHGGKLVDLSLVDGGLEGARQKILCKSRNASVVSRQRIRSKYCLNPSGTEFVLTRLTYLCSGMRDGMHAQRECRLSSRKC